MAAGLGDRFMFVIKYDFDDSMSSLSRCKDCRQVMVMSVRSGHNKFVINKTNYTTADTRRVSRFAAKKINDKMKRSHVTVTL